MITDIKKKTRPKERIPHGVPRERPGKEPVCCPHQPGKPVCGIASHGFVCHFSDGKCLRYPLPEKEEHLND